MENNTINKMFGYPYVQGYLAALQDVLDTIEHIQYDLKGHKRKQNYKTYKAIIECMIKGRAIFREDPYAFVRCNDDGYEIYIEGKGVYDPETRRIIKKEKGK